MNKYFFFSGYFDVFVNALIGMCILFECAMSWSQNETPIDAILYLGAWAVFCYLWLIFTNRGRFVISIFASPLKIILSYVFLFSSAGVIRSIFQTDRPLTERLSKGVISGFFLFLARYTVKKH